MARHLRFIFLILALSLAISPGVIIHSPYLIPNTSGTTNPSNGNPNSTSLDSLLTFERQVYNGDDDQVTGLYIEGFMASSVRQQPQGHAEFVDTGENTVTQFSSASEFGSLGFLAHNYKIGKIFPSLAIGEEIVVVYGDSHTDRFVIMDTLPKTY